MDEPLPLPVRYFQVDFEAFFELFDSQSQQLTATNQMGYLSSLFEPVWQEFYL
jgi:hypothetical protein